MFNRIIALMGKEFIQIKRDRRTLAMIIAIPVIWLVMFGYAADFNVRHLKLVVLNNSQTELGTTLAKAFTKSDSFQLVGTDIKDEASAREFLRLDKADLALIIPSGFGDVDNSSSDSLQVLVDGADFFSAQSATGLVQKTLQGAQSELQTILADENAAKAAQKIQEILPPAARFAVQSGLVDPEKIVAAIPRPTTNLVPKMEFLYNPDVRSAVFMIPGLAAMVILFITVLMTSLGVARERERGTLEQLVVSPLRPLELMVGKVLPYAVVGLLDFTLVLVAAIYLFDVPFAGNLLVFYCVAVFFLLSALGLGLVASAAAQNQQQAMQMAMFISFPQMLLSGVIFPLEAMPKAVVSIAKLLPLTYFIPIARGMFIKGIGLEVLKAPALALVGYGVVMILIASLVFRKRLE